MEMEVQSSDKERFDDFLSRKNIDSKMLNASDPTLYESWHALFSQVHEESFVMLQKFKINPIRRKYPKIQYRA